MINFAKTNSDDIVNIIISPFPLINYDDLILAKTYHVTLGKQAAQHDFVAVRESYDYSKLVTTTIGIHTHLLYGTRLIVDPTTENLNTKISMAYQPKLLDGAYSKVQLMDVNNEVTDFDILKAMQGTVITNREIVDVDLLFVRGYNDDGVSQMYKVNSGLYNDGRANTNSYKNVDINSAIPITNTAWDNYYNQSKSQFDLSYKQAKENRDME